MTNTVKNCKHKNTEVHDGMISTAEAPYDGTDFWWTLNCVDCDEELAEGDGYSKPPKLTNSQGDR